MIFNRNFFGILSGKKPRASVAMYAIPPGKEDFVNGECDPEKLLSPTFNNPIKRLMCCNRGEIAIRVFRCCKENNIASISVFSE